MSRTFAELLEGAPPVWEVPDDDVVERLIIPALSCAKSASISTGWFSARVLHTISPGLQEFADAGGKLRLLVSHEISREDLLAAYEGGDLEGLAANFCWKLFNEELETRLAEHSRRCLAHLVRTGCLELRVAFHARGMFHKKVWLLDDGEYQTVIRGSANMSYSGLFENGEQVEVARTWAGDQLDVVESFRRQFEQDWIRNDGDRQTLAVRDAVKYIPNELVDAGLPLKEEFHLAWMEDYRNKNESLRPDPSVTRLRKPSWLRVDEAPWSHQGEAISALESRGYCGVIAIATGGGKTLTSLATLTRFQDRDESPLVCLICVPTDILRDQWIAEVEKFGVEARKLAGESSLTDTVFQSVVDQASAGTQVLVCTQKTLSSGTRLKQLLLRVSESARVAFIGDEVHNLGSSQSVSSLPECAEFRVGLSATPVRKYDEEGTRAMLQYFAGWSELDNAPDLAYSFELDRAISSGVLVPYNYFPIGVRLCSDEEDCIEDLSEEIRSRFARKKTKSISDESDSALQRLLERRRAVIEQARAKVPALMAELEKRSLGSIQQALIYCSAKASAQELHNERQLDRVREALIERGVRVGQYTSRETAAARKSLMESFRSRSIQCLLAMKVLDEGVDIPSVDAAFVLASQTSEREWIQRLGRILRREEGKMAADFFDFVVLPSDDDEVSQLVERSLQNERERVSFLTRFSNNRFDTNGGQDFQNRYFWAK